MRSLPLIFFSVFFVTTSVLSQTVLTVQSLNQIRFADQYAGGDCGAKIVAADADLGSAAGEIWVNSNCGLNISTPVVINQYHVVKFIDEPPGGYQVSAKIQVGGSGQYGAGIIGLSSGRLSVPGPIMLMQAAGANLPVMVQLAGPQTFIQDIALDGNKAHNATAGTILQLQSATTNTNSAWMQQIDHVTVQNSRGLGIRVISTIAGQETAAPFFDHLACWGNELGCLETEHVVNVIVRQSEIENNGLGGGPLGGANYPTVNTSGSSVTCVTPCGSQWTTDSSIIGRPVIIGGTRYTVSAVSSTTSLTLNASAGTQSAVTMRIGTGMEWYDSRGSAAFQTDISGNELDGIYVYGLEQGPGIGAWGEIFRGDTFAGNMEQDIDILGYDTTNNGYSSYGNQVVDCYFDGHHSGSTATYRTGIYIQDSYGNLINANTFSGSGNQTQGVLVIESVNGREGANARDIMGSANACSGSFSGSCISQNVQNPPYSTPLAAQTGSIGGTLSAGQCVSGTATVLGAVPGMPAIAVPSDGSDVGSHLFIKSYATALNTVTVWVCVANGSSIVIPSKAYNVRLVQ